MHALVFLYINQNMKYKVPPKIWLGQIKTRSTAIAEGPHDAIYMY